MAAGFALDIDMSEALARAPDILSAARQELDRAADRALTKTAKWLRTHSAREIGRCPCTTWATLARRPPASAWVATTIGMRSSTR